MSSPAPLGELGEGHVGDKDSDDGETESDDDEVPPTKSDSESDGEEPRVSSFWEQLGDSLYQANQGSVGPWLGSGGDGGWKRSARR